MMFRFCLILSFLGWGLPQHVQALSPKPTHPARELFFDVYRDWTKIKLLQQFADECRPADKQKNAQVAALWMQKYQLGNTDIALEFEDLIDQILGREERAAREAQAQGELLNQLRRQYAPCLNTYQLQKILTNVNSAPAQTNPNGLVKIQTMLAQNGLIMVSAANASAPVSTGALPVSSRPVLEIDAVYVNELTTFPSGSVATIEYQTYVMFKRGLLSWDARGAFNTSASENTNWLGRWQKAETGFNITAFSGSSFFQLESGKFYRTYAADVGDTLEGEYKTPSNCSYTALGGGLMTFFTKTVRFYRDGRFDAADSQCGSDARGTAGTISKNIGTYQLNGHELLLQFENGFSQKLLFYFFPSKGSKDVETIQIGRARYARR